MGRPPSSDGNSLKKGPWTPEEDKKLVDFINKNGHGGWRALPNLAGLNRCGKSCRLRWANYLRPDIKRGKFSEGEERIIIHLHSVIGNKWSRIATHLPRRTDNEIKNFWNTHLKKKLLQMGIDPITHKPITDLNLLMNLSQLLSSPNFGNVNMNPWDITALRLQADATQLAKIHMLQNLIQVMNNTGSLPNVARESLLGSLNPSPFEGQLVNGTSTLYANTGLTNPEFMNPEVTQQHFSDQAVPNSWASFEGVSNYSFSSSYDQTQTDKPLPGLVSVSPECSSVEQIMGEKVKPITCFSEHSPNSNIFEGWEQLVDDHDQASDSFWREILNETSSSAIFMAELPF